MEGPVDYPFQCKTCNYGTARLHHLVRHEMIHKGDKPFHCTSCDYKTSQRTNLVRHEMTHTGKKIFHCSVCDYKCSLKFNLLRHEAHHTQGKTFHCKSCDYKTLKKLNLRDHEKSHNTNLAISNYCASRNLRNRSLLISTKGNCEENPDGSGNCDSKNVELNQCIKFANLNPATELFHDKSEFKTIEIGEFAKYDIQAAEPDHDPTFNYKTDESMFTKLDIGQTEEEPIHDVSFDYKIAEIETMIKHVKSNTETEPFCNTTCVYKTPQVDTFFKLAEAHTEKETIHDKSAYIHALVKFINLQTKQFHTTSMTTEIDRFSKHVHTQTDENLVQDNTCDYKTTDIGMYIKQEKTEKTSIDICDYKTLEMDTVIKHNNQAEEKTIIDNVMCHYKSRDIGRIIKPDDALAEELAVQDKTCNFKKGVMDTVIKTENKHTENKIDEVLNTNTLHLNAIEQKTQTTKNFNCFTCDFKTVSKRCLVLHEKTHMGEKTSRCMICNYKTTRKSNLVKHKKIHREKIFQVGYQDDIYTTDEMYTKHEETGLLARPFQDLTYNDNVTKPHLKVHEETLTTDKFVCFTCDYKTNCLHKLVRHEMKHTGDKPFHCKSCDYKTAQKVNLERHEKTHTGEKKFQCSFCNYKCNLKFNLIRHESNHTGVKKFCCKICDFQSSRKDNLTFHERKHTEEKTFHCQSCDFKTLKKCHLKNHERTHLEDFCDSTASEKGNLFVTEQSCHFVNCDYKTSKIAVFIKHANTHSAENPLQDYIQL